MEATAVWMEDQVFDDVNDNYGYIQYGPLAFPEAPLDSSAVDRSHTLGLYQYGAFVFIKFLSEGLGPEIVREIFEAGDGVPGQPGFFSTPALELALEARGLRFRDVFASFGAANVDPSSAYEEGADWMFLDRTGKPSPAAVPLPAAIAMTLKRPQRSGGLLIDHMSNRYLVFRPGRGVKPGARLRVAVDAPAAATSHALGIVATAGPTPIVSGVLVGSVSGEILLVDRGGSILWRAQVAGPIEEPPLVQGRQLVVVAGRGDIHAYR